MSNVTLADLVRSGDLEFSDGYRTKSSELAQDGLRIVRAGDIRDGRMVLDGAEFVSDRFSVLIGEKVAKSGDVVLTTKGTVGRTALVRSISERVVYSPQICYFRFPSDSRLHGSFFYYWLQGSEFGRQAGYLMGSSDMAPYLSLRDLSGVQISVPPLGFQVALGEVLGSLDEKIASNSRLVHLLASRFEAMLDAASRLGGDLPLEDVTEFHNRRRVPLSAQQRELRSGDVPYWGANGALGAVDEALFNEALVLVGEDGSVVGEDGRPFAHYVWGPTWINNHAHVLTGKGVSTELLYYLVKRADVSQSVTGAVQPKLSMGNLKRVPLRLPTSSEMTEIESKVSVTQAQIRSARDESRTLAALRDTLLPALMSGRLSVRDAEAAVSEVV